MPRPYSMDLRERVVGAVEAGMSRRAAARLFDVSESAAVKWSQRLRATGSVAPSPMGAPRGSKLDLHEALLLALLEERRDITLAELQARLGESGISAALDTIWRFFKRRGFSFKKNRARQRAGASRRRPGSGPVAATTGPA